MNSHLALFKLKHFQVAIFDEASQILEPHLLSILTSPAIDKIIMIGDHKQLPAVVVQDEKKSAVASPMLHAIGLTNCRNSLFERLYEKYRHREDIVAMLNHQGRMHPDIAAFASRLFYENRLLPVGLPHQKENLLFTNYDEADSIETLVATRRCAFVHVPRPSFEDYMPKANVLEAQRIAQIVKKICIVHQKNGISFDPSRQLGIIVPYRRQIATVHTEVANLLSECGMGNSSQLLIDTVERFQGSQRDIIIYGTTIVQYYELERLSELVTIGETLVDRKLNVAITRARKQFIMLGNEQLLSQNVLYSQLIDFCKGR
jgi:superfamily I DNA and/or RNA helicase